MTSIHLYKHLPIIKGITDNDIHRHINEIVYAFYKENLEVPEELKFNGWTTTPFINYTHPQWGHETNKDLSQYTPY